MEQRIIRHVLVVDDDVVLASTLRLALEQHYDSVRVCNDVKGALAVLKETDIDVVIVDVALPDGSAFDLVQTRDRRGSTPLLVAISGSATAAESFRLGQLGVHEYLSKPFGVSALRAAVERAEGAALDYRPHLRQQVGRQSMREVQGEVRRTLIEEALAREQGSRRGAARLLDVTRQALQYMLRADREPDEPADDPSEG